MADINLLGGNNQKFNLAKTGASFVVKILVGVLILVFLYYGFVRLQISRTRKSVQAMQAKTSQVESETLSQTDRGEVVTRQGQLQNLDTLIKSHVYWSNLLPELAHVTLKSASYAAIDSTAAGVLDLDVIVPTYADADKYIQVFDLPEFNKQFSDVKILSINKVQQGSSVQIEFKLELKFNPEFIHKSL